MGRPGRASPLLYNFVQSSCVQSVMYWSARQCGFYLIDLEDETSAADKPELQRLADQYITDWTQLDWTKL